VMDGRVYPSIAVTTLLPIEGRHYKLQVSKDNIV
jgi:hypothetical protein